VTTKQSDPPNNDSVLIFAQIIKNVMISAADDKIGVLYINVHHAIPIRNPLEEMGHPQPPTTMQLDNTIALGFVSKNLQPKATKSIDMQHLVMRDRQDRLQFKYYWGSGKYNNGD
jgi:hypothetical protein